MTQPRPIQLWLALFTLVGVAEAYLPTSWAIPTETLSQSTGATAVGMINAIGSIAGFAGPYAFGYIYTRTRSVSLGLVVVMVAALAGGLLTLCIPKRRTPAP